MDTTEPETGQYTSTHTHIHSYRHTYPPTSSSVERDKLSKNDHYLLAAYRQIISCSQTSSHQSLERSSAEAVAFKLQEQLDHAFWPVLSQRNACEKKTASNQDCNRPRPIQKTQGAGNNRALKNKTRSTSSTAEKS